MYDRLTGERQAASILMPSPVTPIKPIPRVVRHDRVSAALAMPCAATTKTT
jgi:hypothetical protein